MLLRRTIHNDIRLSPSIFPYGMRNRALPGGRLGGREAPRPIKAGAAIGGRVGNLHQFPDRRDS